MSGYSDSPCFIPVLNSQIPLPQFAFFQVVKVKSTGEVGTISGMKYSSSNERAEEQGEEWLYLLNGLTRLSSVWWTSTQRRSLDRLSISQIVALSVPDDSLLLIILNIGKNL